MYSRYNPVNYSDPDGHCPILIGAGIGALAGGVMYGVTSVVSGRNFSWTDLGVSVAVGAAGGTLIRTGIGAATGVAMLATIGAGTGVLGSELGYQAMAGKNFSSGELITTSAVGGATGAITGALGQPGLNPVVSVGAKLLVQGVSGAADYSLRSLINGDDITAEGVGVSFGVGVGGGLLSEAIPTSTRIMMGQRGYRLYNEQMEKNFVEAFRKPDNTVRQVMRSTIARAELWDGIDDIVRSGGITILQPR